MIDVPSVVFCFIAIQTPAEKNLPEPLRRVLVGQIPAGFDHV